MKNLKPFKQKISVSLDEDIIIEIKRRAEIDERNFSQYVNKILRAHITNDTITEK